MMGVNPLWIAAIPVFVFVCFAAAAGAHSLSERLSLPRWAEWLSLPIFMAAASTWLIFTAVGLVVLLPLAFRGL